MTYSKGYYSSYFGCFIPYRGNQYIKDNWHYKSASQQERIWNCAHDKYVRAKRKHNNLLSSWDDKVPSRLVVTSWKDRSKKRKQYEK